MGLFSTDNHRGLNYTKDCLSLLSENVALQCTDKKKKISDTRLPLLPVVSLLVTKVSWAYD
jgi:hypothetical protein